MKTHLSFHSLSLPFTPFHSPILIFFFYLSLFTSASAQDETIVFTPQWTAQAKGVHVYLKGVSDNVRDVFDITGFISLFEFK